MFEFLVKSYTDRKEEFRKRKAVRLTVIYDAQVNKLVLTWALDFLTSSAITSRQIR